MNSKNTYKIDNNESVSPTFKKLILTIAIVHGYSFWLYSALYILAQKTLPTCVNTRAIDTKERHDYLIQSLKMKINQKKMKSSMSSSSNDNVPDITEPQATKLNKKPSIASTIGSSSTSSSSFSLKSMKSVLSFKSQLQDIKNLKLSLTKKSSNSHASDNDSIILPTQSSSKKLARAKKLFRLRFKKKS